MKRQNRFQHCFTLAVLMGLWAAASPALAQQLASQQSPAPTSDPPSPSAKNGREKKDGDVGIVGKSKLEKETGTVNDRIFEVIPNYGTVEKIGRASCRERV